MKFWPVIFIHAFLSIGVSPITMPLSYNCEIGRYFAMVISQGGLPYLDVFDNKPFLLYQLASFFDFMGPWGYWFLISCFILFAAYKLFLVNKKFSVRYSLIAPLLFVFLIRLTNIYETTGEIREVTSSLLVLAFSFTVLYSGSFLQYTIGFISALIFMMLPIEILAIIPLSVLAIYKTHQDHSTSAIVSISRSLMMQLCGALVVLIPVVIYLLNYGIIIGFWESAFQYNFSTYLSQVTFLDRYHSFIKLYFNYEVLPFTLLFIIIICITFITRSRNSLSKYMYAGIILILVQILASIYSGLSFKYYLMSVIPLLSIFIPVASIFYKRDRLAKNILLSTTISLLIIPTLYSGYRISKYTKGYSLPDFTQKIIPVSGQRGQLYVFGNARYLAINTDLKIIAPSKYAFIHEWNRHSHWDQNGVIFSSIISDIKKYNTKFIVDFSSTRPMIRPELQLKWKDLIHKYYKEIDRDEDIGAVLFELIPNDPIN